MFRYGAYALTIDSELDLGFPVSVVSGVQTDITIRVTEMPGGLRRAGVEEEYLFVQKVGRFLMRGGREMLVEPLPGADFRQVRHFASGRAMAVLMRQRGWLPLHASGVLIGKNVALFAGNSGEGKSTTAAAFHSHGFSVIADDIAAVRLQGDCCEVQPSWSHLKLLENSREVLETRDDPVDFLFDKHCFNVLGEDLRDTFPLARIYTLEYGDAPRIEVVPRLSAVAVLSANTLSGPRMEPELAAMHLDACARVATAITLCRLIRPRGLALLKEVVLLVERDMARRLTAAQAVTRAIAGARE